MRKQNLIFVVLLLFTFFSCKKEDNELPEKAKKGMLISNEGGFNKNNGSVSFFNTDSLEVINDYFKIVNKRPLGDVVQSVSVHNNKAYIVVNNSQKVEVVDIETFNSIATITGVSYPRYFLGIDNNKGYLTNGNMKGNVYVIDLNTYKITDSITVGNGPEYLLKTGDYVYVANSGGWIFDSTVSVIDVNTNKVTNTVKVGDCPVDMVVDKDNNVWVLCKGRVEYDWNTFSIINETPSKIVKINTLTKKVDKEILIGEVGDYYNPYRIAIGKDLGTIYFTENGGVYSFNINADENSISKIISKNFYGLEVNPADGNIYGLFAPGFDVQGYLFRYNDKGALIDSFEVGIGPNGGVFIE
jgi:YVTN family beta-propeller protein